MSNEPVDTNLVEQGPLPPVFDSAEEAVDWLRKQQESTTPTIPEEG